MENKLYPKNNFKNNFLTILSIVFLFFWTINSYSAQITSTNLGGLWKSPGTWVGGSLPTSSDDAVIANGAIVTVDTAVTLKSLTIGQGTSGILQWGTLTNTVTVSGNVLINSGASFLLYTASATSATLIVGGNFTNNGFANLALGVLTFNGSQQSGGSANQILNGTGVFTSNGSIGIIRTLAFQTTGSSTISTSQNLLVTFSFIHSAGSLNTNGKLSLDNTAQVFGQTLNTQVANIVVTNMGSSYTSSPIVSASGAILWSASLPVVAGNILVSGLNVYAVTTAGTTGLIAPVHSIGTASDNTATLLWVGNIGTIGNALIGTVALGTQYFYNNKLYTCIVGGTIDLALPPTHVSGVVASGTASFLYVGPAAQVSVNYDSNSPQTLRSIILTNPGSGYSSAPALSVLATAGSGAIATVVYIPKIDGPGSVTTQKSAISSITGGLTINNTQGASSYSGVGSISTSSPGFNYTVAPQVGFAGPTAINLVTSGGSGFTTVPTITVSGSLPISGAALVSSDFIITVDTGKIISVYLKLGTIACYTVPPTLTITGGGGSGATLAFPVGCWPTATAVIGTNRQVTNFTINSSGFGYVTAPLVSVGTTGVFVTEATNLACRIALYNLTYGFLTPAASNITFTEGVEVPSNRKMNLLIMNSAFGATFTNNLELFSLSPLILTNGKIDFGLNNLTLSNASYAGISSTANSSISGSITLSSIGGLVTKTFPFNRTVVVTTGTGSVTGGSSITSLKITRTAPPTGSVTPNTNYPTGSRSYRLQTNIGGVYGASPTVQLNYGTEDGLLSDNPGLLIAKATAGFGGPWTIVSTSSGAGALTIPGTRTTSSFTGTGDDYLAFTTTFSQCISTPVAGTIPSVLGFCTASNLVTINLTGYSATASGLTFAWEQSTDNISFVPAIGSGTNSPVFTSPIISSTIYYRCVVTCSGSSPAISNTCKAGPVICQYNVSRNTGITYNSIITPNASGTPYSGWSGGAAAGNDEFTNAVSLSGTTFLYQGVSVNSFYASTNGFISFNTTTPNASPSNDLTSGTLTSQVLAPFWDDLTLRGALASNHDNCMRYKINGTLGSGADIIIEWADLEKFNFGVPNINFQIVLHESDNSIDFNYGNFQLYDGSVNPNSLFSYSVGLNGTAPGGTTLSDRMILQRANQNFFSIASQPSISLTPACFSQFHFVPAVAYTGSDPGAPGIPANDEKINAITVAVNTTPCTALCGNIFTSTNATASSGITACSAVPPGNPDDDVWFKFVTTSQTQYKIEVTSSINYDAVVQLLDASLNPIQCVNAKGAGLSESIIASPLSPIGTTFFIRIYDAGTIAGSTSNGEFALCVSQFLAQPANDECAGATSLTIGSTCTPTASILPSTLAATASLSIPVCSAASPGLPDDDVWYTFTTNNILGLTYNISVTGSSTYNAVLQLTSGSCGSLTAISCVNATGNGGTEIITTSSLAVNTIYRIRVYHAGSGAGSGNFNICVYITPPPCPVGFIPANGTPVLPASGVTLKWSPVSVASGYYLYLDTMQSNVTNEVLSARHVINLPDTMYATGPLVLGKIYYWKVLTLSNSIVATGCSVNNFNTNPPPCVEIISPLNSSPICYKTAFKLTWKPSFGATGYDVYLNAGPSSPTTNVSANQADTTFNIALNSLTSGLFSWRIAPRNFIGPNSSCSNNTFTINIPPTISILSAPLSSTVCNGQKDTLTASGAASYFWSPSIGLNFTTGSIVFASPSSTTTYTVSGENVSGCASTASQTVTINPTPTAPITTGYSLCLQGTIPAAQGLTASCGSNNITKTITIPLSNPATNEGSTCPGSNTIGSFTIPALPSGSTLLSASLTISGIIPLGASLGTEVRLNLSGTGIIGTNTCFQGVATNTNPFDYITGIPNLNDTASLAALINPLGGAVNIKYNDIVNSILTGPDVTFPSTATFTYTFALLSSPKWYNASVGGSLVGSGTPFNPIPGALANSNTLGTYPFYARCSSSLCESVSTPANLDIGILLVVTPSQSATGQICAGVNDSLKTVIAGGSPQYSYSWAPTTGLNNSTISNPIATPATTTTYTVTVTDGCNKTASSTITVSIITAPNVQVTPANSNSCVRNLSSFSLVATGADNFTWLPTSGLSSSTGFNVLANPSSTTIYTVTGTSNATGCTAKATAKISVGDTLNVTATASPSSLCPNGSSQLNASVILNSFYCRTTQGGSPTITNVTFNTISNLGVVSVSPFFDTYPFTGNTTTQVFQGSTYSLTVATAASAIVSVWIDYNRNEIYDSTEWNQVYTSGTTGTISIQIPANALSGVTGIRIRSSGLAVPNAAINACTAFPSGTCQNYIITIGNPAPTIGFSWSPSTFLNSTTISNPFASNVTGNTNTYTVTTTNLSGGCTATASVTLSITPFTSVAINSAPANPTICAGNSQLFTSTVTGGSRPFTYSWSPATGLSSTTDSSVIASPTSTTIYTLTVKDNCNITRVSSPITLVVNSSPVTTVTSNPLSSTICVSGSIILTANGANTYSWAPAIGLNTTNTQSVTATPLSTTTYTVTGTTNNCSSTATKTINYSPPIVINATADANPGCSPLTTQLHANAFNPNGSAANYTFLTSTGITLNSMTGSTVVIGNGVDNTPTATPVPIGFNFTYEGISYSTYSVSPDGWIKLGSGNASAENINSVSSTVNTPKIYPYWGDIATGTTGDIKTLVSGNSPNRIFIVQWFVTVPRALAGPANSTFQAWLYESSGKIEFRYGIMGSVVTGASIGITGGVSSNFNSVTLTPSISSSNTVPNNAINGHPVTGTIFTFNPLSYSLNYIWTPSTNLNSTTLANPTISNLSTPTSTYTVTVTNSVGCSGSGSLILNINPSPIAPAITYPGSPNTAALTFCLGGSVLLNATSGYSSYSWSNGNTVVATTQSYSASASGTYTVSGVVANGCSASSSVVVNVQTATTPVITYPGFPSISSLTFCQGGSVSLSTTIPYTSYSWSNGGPPIGTASSYSATTSGIYRVTATAGNGCTASSTVSVNVIPGPPAPVITASGSTTLCNDASSSVVLSATNLNGLTPAWNDVLESTTNAITVIGNGVDFQFGGSPYSFFITITDPITQCSSISNIIVATQINCGSGVLFNSKIFIQGFYTSGGFMKNSGTGFLNVVSASSNPLDVDTVTLYAMASSPPHLEVDHKKGILKTNGDISVVFGPSVVAGTSYYIKIKHQNSIETWSALPVLFASSTTYLFTSNISKAFGDNLIETPDHMGWAIYNGDINQDGAIDFPDFLDLDPSIQNGDGGYLKTDLNGDGGVDGLDFLVLDPNIQGGIGIATPP